MSLVENLVNQISSINGVTRPQGFDLNDETFAKLLEKASAKPEEVGSLNTIQLGAPAGFEIEPFDSLNTDGVNNGVQETQKISNEPVEIKDIDMSDYFSIKLKNSDNDSDFMNFAKKQAANAYNIFGKSFITDLSEFVQDTAAML